jgi:hypothetical protein
MRCSWGCIRRLEQSGKNFKGGLSAEGRIATPPAANSDLKKILMNSQKVEFLKYFVSGVSCLVKK